MSFPEYVFGKNTDWMFMETARPHLDSAWLGHIPFAHWLTQKFKPTTFVELGTWTGSSFAAFCEANTMDYACFVAIDNWEKDVNIPNYPPNVYEYVQDLVKPWPFAELMKMDFDDAVGKFEGNSISLLHIDGLHDYDSVKHDFELWLPKMQNGGIILFHDIACEMPGFGVKKFWEEIKPYYKTFEFNHSFGLGVLAVQPSNFFPLFQFLQPPEIKLVQDRFAYLGQQVINQATIEYMRNRPSN